MYEWDIEIKAGETLQETISFKEDDGTPVDITGASFLCQIRKTAQSDEILGTPILSIVDAVNGKIGLDFGLSNSQALPTTGLSLDQLDVWVWDAFIFYADGSSECLWEGKFKVSPRVSQHG